MDSVTPRVASVDCRVDGAVAWITMNRPRCHKARYNQVASGRVGIKAMLASNAGAN